MPSGLTRRIYELLPPAARERIYRGNVRTYVRDWTAARAKYLEARTAPELGWAHLAQLAVVPNREALLGRLPRASRVALVGADGEDTVRRVIEITAPEELHLIADPSRPSNRPDALLRARFAPDVTAGRVHVPVGTWDDQVSTIPPRSLGWVLINCTGPYAQWNQMLAHSARLLTATGILAGGDYRAPSCGDAPESPAVQAVHEFCLTYRWQMILLTHESHRTLSFALTPISAFEPDDRA